MLDKVRCKFKCTNKTETEYGTKVILEPVVNGSKENNLYFKFTPSGKYEVSLLTKEAADYYQVGKYYYIDSIRAEEE